MMADNRAYIKIGDERYPPSRPSADRRETTDADLHYTARAIDQIDRRLKAVETISEPDEADLHNINRRIELLAQRVATLESKQLRDPMHWQLADFFVAWIKSTVRASADGVFLFGLLFGIVFQMVVNGQSFGNSVLVSLIAATIVLAVLGLIRVFDQ